MSGFKLEKPELLNRDQDSLEVVPGFAHEKLEGWVPELA